MRPVSAPVRLRTARLTPRESLLPPPLVRECHDGLQAAEAAAPTRPAPRGAVHYAELIGATAGPRDVS